MANNISPMMMQYLEIKEKYNDTILFFRLGDFYEMFYEDARLASKELELTLTGKDCGQGERAPMCGIPYHSCDAYISRLVSKGYKIAICDQVGEIPLRGIVKRDVVRVVTPGTVIEGSMLEEGTNNFICAIHKIKGSASVCFCDVSTGELKVTSWEGVTEVSQKVKNELLRFMPSEILYCGDSDLFSCIVDLARQKINSLVDKIDETRYTNETCEKLICGHFKKSNLSDLSLNGKELLTLSLGVLIDYLRNTQKLGLERISTISFYNDGEFMKLDPNTRRNLELTETLRNKSKIGSLLGVVDQTRTAMGKRMIKTWIEQPLFDMGEIIKRQDAVEELLTNSILLNDLKEQIAGIYDMERLITRVIYGSSNARELRSLCYTFSRLPGIKNQLKIVKSDLLNNVRDGIDDLSDLCVIIDDSVVDEPPVSIKDGDIIRQGYNKELDLLKGDLTDGNSIIAEIETREKERTGISKLKIGYNKVFGYYIEVSNSYKNKVPGTYTRKQTLANCERYITGELKELEGRILGAKERAISLEYDLFCEIRTKVGKNLERIQKTAKNIAILDVLLSFGWVARSRGYTRPEVNLGSQIIIKDGRHPVVETLLKDIPFVPNDVNLDDKNRLAIITGPNMAGKSTYMRQAAIIVLMAQVGMFVPAREASIGLVDSIFTRVGASDDLSSGQSTFMVEMLEVSQILKEATSRSFLILDEIGRGTSTFDGMSIARAVVEYVVNREKLGAKTLFATHYHELTDLEDSLDGVKNYNIAVKKRGDDIIFLRRIVKGPADESYGIEVAKLAGVPEWVIGRAREVLLEIETGLHKYSIPVGPRATNHTEEPEESKKSLNNCKEIIQKIKNVDISTITPIEAMNTLFELSRHANSTD